MNFEIRDAVAADAKTIAAYNSEMAIETEGHPLAAEIIEAGVAGLLSNTANGRYWVAEADGKLVGQIMVTYEWSDWRNGKLWWIQSVYIHPDYRRAGIFSALYHHVESLAKSVDGVRGLRLYVENDNKRAQKTYEALGMVDPNYKVMQAIFEDPTC
jgi:ribosomal protein S18 acetylase RimI-like enzyme